jgi:hypothetical protein
MPSTGGQQCATAGAEQPTQRCPDGYAPTVERYYGVLALTIKSFPDADANPCSNGRSNERVSPTVLLTL